MDWRAPSAGLPKAAGGRSTELATWSGRHVARQSSPESAHVSDVVAAFCVPMRNTVGQHSLPLHTLESNSVELKVEAFREPISSEISSSDL